MNDSILFSETQRFRQWWLWACLFALDGLFIFGIYEQILNGRAFGDKPASDAGLIFFSLIPFLLTAFFLMLRLETIVKDSGIYVRFYLFHLKVKHFPWVDIDRAYIKKYNALLEYGGWGVRVGFGKGPAYNVSGNMGLQLVFNNKEKLLIGTRRPEELSRVLQKLGYDNK